MTSARLGDEATVDNDVRLGYGDGEPPVIGDRATIRSGSIIYTDVEVGDDLTTGHNVLIRAGTEVGDDVVVGTDVVLDGDLTVGSGVSLQTGAYVPPKTVIEDDVFIGPHAVLTNDPYPIRRDVDLAGPTLEAHASIGANATVLPDVTVGEGAFVAAGATATADVPPETLAVGTPAECRNLPADLDTRNRIR